jgi:hypothetical protein
MGGYCRVFDCVRAYNDKPVKRENAEKKDD